MLKVEAKEMPVDLSMWVLSCFDPIRSELAIPGRGSIPVNAESYSRVFGIRNEGTPVRYEMETEAIDFFIREYGIEGGEAPDWADWCTIIKNMEGAADEKFLRAYFAAVISCFVSPSTKSSISPRCYTSLVDLNQFRRTNYAQFAIDQIITEVKKMGVKKKSVCCCLHHLVILYLDSVEVDEDVQSEENCPIRAAAWNDRLIQAVMRKDRKSDGQFGKLKLKEGVGATIRDSLFVGMTRTEEFVSSKLPRRFSNEKKRKIAIMLGELCTDISNRLGIFVEAFGSLDSNASSSNVQDRSRKKRKVDVVDGKADGVNGDEDEDDDEDYNESSESEDTAESEDDDEDDDEDDRGINNGPDVDDLQGEPEGQDLNKMQPRRSARLTPKKHLEGPASNLRERSTDSEITPDAVTNQPDGLSANGSIQSARRNEMANTLDYSPFSELKKSAAARTRSEIDLPEADPPELSRANGKRYAQGVFMDPLTPASGSVLNQFGRDAAIKNLTAECFNLQNLQIRDDQRQRGVAKKKMVAHRGRPNQTEVEATTAVPNCSSNEQNPAAVVTVPSATTVTAPAPRQLKMPTTSAAEGATSDARGAAQGPLASSTTGHVQRQDHVAPPRAVPPSKAQPAAVSNVLAQVKKVPTPPGFPAIKSVTAPPAINTSRVANTLPLHTNLPTQKVTGPTRETCPPPVPKFVPLNDITPMQNATSESRPPPSARMDLSEETRLKWARAQEACDAPTFNIGFESPEKQHANEDAELLPSKVITRVNLNSERIVDDDPWDDATWIEACKVVEEAERVKGMKNHNENIEPEAMQPDGGFQTPVRAENTTAINSSASGSTTAADRPQLKERRIIRQARYMRSPYTVNDDKSLYVCSTEVKELYNRVIAHGRRTGRGQDVDKTPIIVSYEKFFISLRELANSMMPCGSLKNTVMELGIESIMIRKEKKIKKLVMPLRVASLLGDLEFNQKELKKHFSKGTAHLDRKDSVMLPVLENLVPEGREVVNHYWLLVINIRDKRFEVLDSLRSLADKKFDENVKGMVACIKTLWEQNYASSPVRVQTFETVDIKPPRQGTNTECGICTLFNAEHWNGRTLPGYGPANIPNIRKLLTHSWVTSVKNSVKWKDALNKK